MGWSVRRIVMVSVLAVVCATPVSAGRPESSGSPNWVPEMSFSYVDPKTGERVDCGKSCRRFTVPAGVELEVGVRVLNRAGGGVDDPVAWDLWFNQPLHPFPGLDISDCTDADTERTDKACWQALRDRVDWSMWSGLEADVACVPYETGHCRDEVVRVTMDPDFGGARRKGVYHFGVWVDRFHSAVESDEFDNFAGPVRITVDQDRYPDNALTESNTDPESTSDALVVGPSSPQPYGVIVVPAVKETSISLTSHRARGTLEFSPGCVGNVSVEVSQSGKYETMVVRIEKVSTGEVLAEGVGKGRMRLEGGVDAFLLRDDRRFRVVVSPGQGSRGVRATARVSYPESLRYVRN